MGIGLPRLDEILKEMDKKQQELNSLIHNTADYHSGVILDKSRVLDRLITEFYETKQRE